MNKKIIKAFIVATILINSGCIMYAPSHYGGHYHKPRYTNHHGEYPHPFGEHYNENKNFYR